MHPHLVRGLSCRPVCLAATATTSQVLRGVAAHPVVPSCLGGCRVQQPGEQLSGWAQRVDGAAGRVKTFERGRVTGYSGARSSATSSATCMSGRWMNSERKRGKGRETGRERRPWRSSARGASGTATEWQESGRATAPCVCERGTATATTGVPAARWQPHAVAAAAAAAGVVSCGPWGQSPPPTAGPLTPDALQGSATPLQATPPVPLSLRCCWPPRQQAARSRCRPSQSGRAQGSAGVSAPHTSPPDRPRYRQQQLHPSATARGCRCGPAACSCACSLAPTPAAAQSESRPSPAGRGR